MLARELLNTIWDTILTKPKLSSAVVEAQIELPDQCTVLYSTNITVRVKDNKIQLIIEATE